ncbi:MAG TPA: glycosyltransferase family 2 protein [bacterium]
MPDAPEKGYCVIIPAYKAEETIAQLVRASRAQGLPVVVVDDGSHDRTAQLASKEGAVVISHLKNRGKGTALRTGFRHALRAGYAGVITLDSDGQHDPRDIPVLIQAGERQHAGIVVGNRMPHGGAMPPMRRWTNQFMSWVVSALTRQRIPDSQCGFRFIHRGVLTSVRLRSRRFEIETELLLEAARRRWKMVSAPVQTIYRNEASYIRPLRDTVRFLGVVARHLLRA